MKRKKRLFLGLFLGLFFLSSGYATAFAETVYPPWCEPPQNGKNFTIRQIDDVPDLHGDIVNPQLVIFFAGNQFMVAPDLVKAFQEIYPQYKRIYVETLPPGILADSIEKGALIIGNRRIAIQPDVFTAGKERIEKLQKEKGWFDESSIVHYARNKLAIMVRKGNPGNVHSLEDLKWTRGRKIFEQEQIARAAELGLGASSPDEIQVIPVGEESAAYCSRAVEKLMEG